MQSYDCDKRKRGENMISKRVWFEVGKPHTMMIRGNDPQSLEQSPFKS